MDGCLDRIENGQVEWTIAEVCDNCEGKTSAMTQPRTQPWDR